MLYINQYLPEAPITGKNRVIEEAILNWKNLSFDEKLIISQLTNEMYPKECVNWDAEVKDIKDYNTYLPKSVMRWMAEPTEHDIDFINSFVANFIQTDSPTQLKENFEYEGQDVKLVDGVLDTLSKYRGRKS